jgi:anti-anti-sigma factor
MTAVDAARAPDQVQAEASLSVLSRPGFTIARLEGDLDIASTPALRERLLSVLGPGVRLLIIDLSGVSFCDVSGLGVLIGTQRRARGLRITVRLAAPSPQMAKLLRVTGLESHFTICATLDDALPCQGQASDRDLPADHRGPPGDAENLIPRVRKASMDFAMAQAKGRPAGAAAAR